jgi:hypothetical protein
MSFKIEPKGGPGFVNAQAQANAPAIGAPGSPSAMAKSSRERAIAAYMGQAQQAQATSVQDPTNISPEEMVGIRQEAEAAEPSGQIATEEATRPTPAKVEEPLSPQFAVLARKEKALRAEVAKLRADREAFKAEQSQVKGSTEAPVKAPVTDQTGFISKDRLKQDMMGVFEELGYTTEDIANKLLSHQPVDPNVRAYIAKLEEKLAKVEATQDEVKSTFEKQSSESYEQAVSAIRFEAEDLVSSDPEFQMIKETGQTEEIVNLIKDVHAQGLPGKFRKGTLLTVEQAARLVEDELINQWVDQSEKLSKLDKIKQRLNKTTPDGQPATTQGKQTQNTSANQTRTLTNGMSSTPKMSARDRAIAAFEGKLKTS